MYSMFGKMHIKLQWYSIFPALFFLFLIMQCNFFPLQLRHETSATKLRYLRSSAFYRQPVLDTVYVYSDGHFYLLNNISEIGLRKNIRCLYFVLLKLGEKL